MQSRWAATTRRCRDRQVMKRRLLRDSHLSRRRSFGRVAGRSNNIVALSRRMSGFPLDRCQHYTTSAVSLQRPLHTGPAAVSAFSKLDELNEDHTSVGAVEHDKLYDEEIEIFSRACLSHMLGDLDYQEYEEDTSSPSSLDYELGEATIWDAPAREETSLNEDDEHDDEIIEEHVTRTGTKFETVAHPVESLSRPRQHRRQAQKRSTHDMLLRFEPDQPPDNIEDLQLWLECESQRESVSNYREIIESAREREDFTSLTMVQRQLRDWYEPLKNAIENQQRAYFLKSEKKKDINRWGPYLCLLQPQKLAVIVAHEALVNTVLYPYDGIPIASLAMRIGTAVEAEVNVQRLLLQQLEEARKQEAEPETESDDGMQDVQDNDGHGANDSSTIDSVGLSQMIDSWMYGSSHLQRFINDANKMDPGKKQTRVRNVSYANRRARKLLNTTDPWSDVIKVKLGVALLEMILNVATVRVDDKEENAFTYEKQRLRNKKQVGCFFLHSAISKMVLEDSFDSLEASTTRFKPMIIAPRDWVSPDDGGYSWLKTEFMRTHGSMVQKAALHEADLSTIFDGLNVLGRVPWVINKEVLKVGERCWKDDFPLGDIPSRTDLEVPLAPARPEKAPQGLDKESEEYKASRLVFRKYREDLIKHRRIHQKNMDLRSLRCSAILKLDQARKFQDHEIYFPYNIDFRGRAYPVPPHLSNVGSDLCRGMLKFADAKPLGDRGLYWLKVHLANLAGNDKLTFAGRADFTDDNMHNVRAAVDDPFGENRWWMTLDDPFQGLATCHEIAKAIDSGDPATYMCSLPVHMDGSCNGLQHYAALGLDRVGGRAVNLCDDDRPQDVYIGVMHEVIRRVAEEAATDLSYADTDPQDLTKQEQEALKRNQAAKLVNGLIDRGVVKRTVMTSVYGVTYIGARKQIQEKIEEKLEEAGHDIDDMEDEIHKACGYLASLTMEVMGELFTGARQTMNWLTACARLISQQGQPVAFVSPLGIPVVQPYRRAKPYTIVTLLQSIVLMHWSDDLPIHKQKQVTAFPPNYVHSLDSSHMILTALEMDRRGLAFSAVHDSFWTHPCDVDEMNEALRECFVQLYSQPLLESLKQNWELRYPSIAFPDLPERGDLDLNEVRRAKYFFQ